MGIDWVARGLAIGGLVSAVVATGIALLNYRRDRPRLRLFFEYGATQENWNGLEVRVVNAGYRPVTVTTFILQTAKSQAALWRQRREFDFWNRHGRLGRWIAQLRFGDQLTAYGRSSTFTQPAALQPGETTSFIFSAGYLAPFAKRRHEWVRHKHLYVTVQDALNREITRKLSSNESAAVYRMGSRRAETD